MSHWGIPGVGGSLGKCAVCGKDFALEVLTGKEIKPFSIGGIEATLYAHEACVEPLKKACASKDWRDLPQGPLRELFDEQEPRDKASGKESTDE